MCALAPKRTKVTGRRKSQGKGKGRPKPFKDGKITLGEIRKVVKADKKIKI